MAKDPKRRRRSNGFLDILNGLLMLLVLGLIVAVGAFFWGASQFYAEGPVAEDTTFFVERGNGLGTIAQRLTEQGLVQNGLLFRAGAWTTDRGASVILPGEYKIPAKASMADILDIITSGEPVEYFVMVNPGQSSYEVAAALNDPAQNLTGDPVAVPPEGSVLPIRHDYFPRDDRAELLKTMQDQMTAKVDELWAACRPDVCGENGVLKSKKEFVILASIVEKETGIASERPIVASLFINRLREGMRLQTDPTILYGIYQGVPQEKLTITASQKAKETPYNTYVIDGLPPTPIANPGVAALEAVANPADTDYLYMMAVTPGDYSDGHYFATTLPEHQANEQKYRRQERELANGTAADAEEAPAEDAGTTTQ
jgi:UPF0755 protein